MLLKASDSLWKPNSMVSQVGSQEGNRRRDGGQLREEVKSPGRDEFESRCIIHLTVMAAWLVKTGSLTTGKMPIWV